MSPGARCVKYSNLDLVCTRMPGYCPFHAHTGDDGGSVGGGGGEEISRSILSQTTDRINRQRVRVCV